MDFFVCSAGDGTQGVTLARQVLCHLSHAPSHFWGGSSMGFAWAGL
jgi:hypothetical protein